MKEVRSSKKKLSMTMDENQEGGQSFKRVCNSNTKKKSNVKLQLQPPVTLVPHETLHDDPEKVARTLFVSNIPLSFTKKKLYNMFKKIGKVESVRFRSSPSQAIKNPKKAFVKQRGFLHQSAHFTAYVVMAELETLQDALLLNGKEVDGHRIRVNSAHISGHDHKKSVFIGNLPYDIQEDEVWAFFQECGVIRNIRIIRDAVLKIGKGFGYVLFDNKDGVTLALEKNGNHLNGRSIRVFHAKSEKQLYSRKTSVSSEANQQVVNPGKRSSRRFNFEGFGSKQGRNEKKRLIRKIKQPKRKKILSNTANDM